MSFHDNSVLLGCTETAAVAAAAFESPSLHLTYYVRRDPSGVCTLYDILRQRSLFKEISVYKKYNFIVSIQDYISDIAQAHFLWRQQPRSSRF